MANIAAKIGAKTLSLAIGIPVGIVAKRTVKHAWRAARPGDPPREPTDPDARWRDAIGWAAFSAAGVAAGELITSRAVTSVWRTMTGHEAPRKNAGKKGHATSSANA
ncbi:MAG: DUF4235 domain-containing protein [Actinomycetia bacterium]|nr:DUF4235 domain-containing protein [Actinomycetes bacterium]